MLAWGLMDAAIAKQVPLLLQGAGQLRTGQPFLFQNNDGLVAMDTYTPLFNKNSSQSGLQANDMRRCFPGPKGFPVPKSI